MHHRSLLCACAVYVHARACICVCACVDTSVYRTSEFKSPRAVLIITANHQTFSGQFWYLSGQTQFDLTHLLYIINGKVSVFLEDKVMSGQISTLIISTARVCQDIPQESYT